MCFSFGLKAWCARAEGLSRSHVEDCSMRSPIFHKPERPYLRWCTLMWTAKAGILLHPLMKIPLRNGQPHGVIVRRVRKPYAGRRFRYDQYFSSSLTASKHMGYRSDVVGKTIRRESKSRHYEGYVVVNGVYLQSARNLYDQLKAAGSTFGLVRIHELFEAPRQKPIKPPRPKRLRQMTFRFRGVKGSAS
jgi:hypothetical protein